MKNTNDRKTSNTAKVVAKAAIPLTLAGCVSPDTAENSTPAPIDCRLTQDYRDAVSAATADYQISATENASLARIVRGTGKDRQTIEQTIRSNLATWGDTSGRDRRLSFNYQLEGGGDVTLRVAPTGVIECTLPGGVLMHMATPTQRNPFGETQQLLPASLVTYQLGANARGETIRVQHIDFNAPARIREIQEAILTGGKPSLDSITAATRLGLNVARLVSNAGTSNSDKNSAQGFLAQHVFNRELYQKFNVNTATQQPQTTGTVFRYNTESRRMGTMAVRSLDKITLGSGANAREYTGCEVHYGVRRDQLMDSEKGTENARARVWVHGNNGYMQLNVNTRTETGVDSIVIRYTMTAADAQALRQYVRSQEVQLRNHLGASTPVNK